MRPVPIGGQCWPPAITSRPEASRELPAGRSPIRCTLTPSRSEMLQEAFKKAHLAPSRATPMRGIRRFPSALPSDRRRGCTCSAPGLIPCWPRSTYSPAPGRQPQHVTQATDREARLRGQSRTRYASSSPPSTSLYGVCLFSSVPRATYSLRSAAPPAKRFAS